MSIEELDKIERALLVIVLNTETREWLKAHDPKALNFAFDALHAEGSGVVSVSDFRREHCRTEAEDHECHGPGICGCMCGPCTADYVNGVWQG